jgi:exopolyphosphatase/guanosine-5'-triphosphate,3'-diphosphate pyrophosphatase
MERALTTLELFAHFCAATGLGDESVDAVATSAIRSASNREAFLSRARECLPVRVLSDESEARYGFLAAVNSTSLEDGAVLDLGGGSLQLVRVGERRATKLRSWPLGAVRMTEAFLPRDAPAKNKHLRALRRTSSTSWATRRGCARPATASWRSAARCATSRSPPRSPPACPPSASRGSSSPARRSTSSSSASPS